MPADWEGIAVRGVRQVMPEARDGGQVAQERLRIKGGVKKPGQKGWTMTMMTATIMSKVGTSLAIL